MKMDIGDYYESVKDSIKLFIDNIEKESVETKEAFKLLTNSIHSGVDLTDEEKNRVVEQMKDVFKTIGLVGVSVLPGSSILFILTTYLKLNKYILPSSFK